MSTVLMDAKTETYHDVQAIIGSIVHRNQQQTQAANIDDRWGEANLLFMEAYHTYRPPTKFSTWVHYKVLHGLMDSARKRSRRSSKEPALVNPLTIDTTPQSTNCFALIDLLDELSDDAKAIVRLVLDTPAEIRLHLLASPGYSNRKVIRDYLSELGWAAGRITSTFREITAALQ